MAKVGRHPGELYPRVGFIVTNLPGRPNGSSKPARGAVIALRDNRFANPAGLVDLIQRTAGTLKIRPDQKIVYLRNWDDEKERLAGVARLLQALVKIARAAKAAGDAQLPPASPALVNPRVARRA